MKARTRGFEFDARAAWIALQLVLGPAVVGSYVWGAMAHPDAMPGLWGDLPAWATTPYTACMPFAAVGWLVLSWVLLRGLDEGHRGWRVVLGATATILVCSTAWLPLCVAVLVDGRTDLVPWVQVDLLGTAAGALVLLVGIARWRPPGWGWALAGAVAFCVQTVVLDALIWTRFWPAA